MKLYLSLIFSLLIFSTSLLANTQRIYSEKNPGEFIEVKTVEIEGENLVQLVVSMCNQSHCSTTLRTTMTKEKLAEKYNKQLTKNRIIASALTSFALMGSQVGGMLVTDFLGHATSWGTPVPKSVFTKKNLTIAVTVSVVAGATAYFISSKLQSESQELNKAIMNDLEEIHLKRVKLDRLFEQFQIFINS